MRFPSLRQAVTTARSTAARFPIVLLSGVTAAVAGVALVDSTDQDFWERLLATATLGLPLFTGLTLWAESKGWTGNRAAGLSAAGAFALAVFFLFWPTWSEPVRMLRYVQLSFALHLLVAFLPYAHRNELNGFWQYNRLLLERFVTAGVYAFVLFVGLVVALLGVDNLLGVNIDDEAYPRLWFIVTFAFSPWVFAAAVPRDFAALERETYYPQRLKTFMQFALVPLVTIYLVILTLYLGRIVVWREWPSGWIGYLVSSVAVVGILSLLLVHPVADRKDTKWIATYARWFYIALIPSIVMLLLAIWKRIAQYGVTEERYFLVVLALWLTAIAGYFGWSRSRNIKLIPISLCVLAFVTFAGPWGAYRWSERSQVDRLREILTRYDMLTDGTIRAPSVSLADDDSREVSAVLRYLVRTHGAGGVAEWFPEPDTPEQIAALDRAPSLAPEERVQTLVGMIGVPYVFVGPGGGRVVNLFTPSDSARAMSVVGFDFVIDAARIPRETVEVGAAQVSYSEDDAELHVVVANDTLRVPLEPAIAAARGGPSQARPPVVIDAASGRVRARLLVTHLFGEDHPTKFALRTLGGLLLVGF